MDPENANGNSSTPAGTPLGGSFGSGTTGGGLNSGSFGSGTAGGTSGDGFGGTQNGDFSGSSTGSFGSAPTGTSTGMSFPQNNMVASGSGTGDIVLQPEKKPKKKGLIIGIIVILIAVVVVAVLAVLSLNKTNTSGESSGDVKTTFTKFANYIVNGNEDSDFSASDYNRNTFYALNQAIADHDEEYLATANQLLENFVSKVDLENEEDSTSVMASTFKTDWALIYAYGKNFLYDEESFVNYYLANGLEATNTLIESERQSMVSLEAEQANTVAEAYLSYEDYLLEFMDAIEQAGCIENGEADESCADKVEFTQEQLDEASEAISGKEDADQIMEALVREFIQSLWAMQEVLNEE